MNIEDGQVLRKDNLKSPPSVLDPLIHVDVIGGSFSGTCDYAESFALSVSSTKSIVDRVFFIRILSREFNECNVLMPHFLTLESTHWGRSTLAELEEWVRFEVPRKSRRRTRLQM